MSVFGFFLICIFPYSGWIRRDTPYLQMWENTVQKNFKYGHFSRGAYFIFSLNIAHFGEKNHSISITRKSWKFNQSIWTAYFYKNQCLCFSWLISFLILTRNAFQAAKIRKERSQNVFTDWTKFHFNRFDVWWRTFFWSEKRDFLKNLRLAPS